MSLVLMLFNWRRQTSTVYLSLAFIFLSVYGVTHYLIVDGDSAFWLAIFYNHPAPLYLMVGPLLFFYVRDVLTDRHRLRRWDVLHFIPAFIHFIGIIPWCLQSFQQKKALMQKVIDNMDALAEVHSNLFFSMPVAFNLRLFSLGAYVIAGIVLLWRYYPLRRQRPNVPSVQSAITLRWLMVLLGTLLLIFINMTVMTWFFLHSGLSHTIRQFAIMYSITGFVYALLAVWMLLFPQVLYGMPAMQLPVPPTEPAGKEAAAAQVKTKAVHKAPATLQEENPFKALEAKILAHLQTEKPYIQPDFDIYQLSKALGVPLHHLYYCFNEVMHTKFATLRMQYRVAHAMQLMQAGQTENFTIEAIAHQSGFQSKSSFYKAFKEVTGMLPSEFVAKVEAGGLEDDAVA
ncbi:MAG: AraC family transcriptional regulator [Chitinophagaceae bacterium]|nr:AraC family transcriptional regulator [Chitinophagaceae bacterium]